MRFVIYAYGGLHGIYDICVTEINSLDEVDNIGETLNAEAAELGYEEFVNKYCKVEGMNELLAALDVLQQVDDVGHTTVGKYTVDTCFEGENYETAIWINPDHMAIPAVYPNRAAAEQGHKFWCLAAAMAPTQVWDTATRTYLTL